MTSLDSCPLCSQLFAFFFFLDLNTFKEKAEGRINWKCHVAMEEKSKIQM